MNPDQQDRLYKVQKTDDGKFLVLNGTDRTIMNCHDIQSANHYMSLLNEAFKSGYKSGLHDAGSDSLCDYSANIPKRCFF